jgi:hypothetical protein
MKTIITMCQFLLKNSLALAVSFTSLKSQPLSATSTSIMAIEHRNQRTEAHFTSVSWHSEPFEI